MRTEIVREKEFHSPSKRICVSHSLVSWKVMAHFSNFFRHYFGSIFACRVRTGDDANTAVVLGMHDNNDEKESVTFEPAHRRILKLGEWGVIRDQQDRASDWRYDRVVQLHFTTEIEVFCVLFNSPLPFYHNTSQTAYKMLQFPVKIHLDLPVQPADIGWPTGNGKKLSNSQACCLAQLCLAAA